MLSGEEAHLWGLVARLITPLPGRASLPPPDEPPRHPPAMPARPAEQARKTAPEPALPAKARRFRRLAEIAPSPSPAPQRVPPPASVPAAPRPPGLERKERKGLERGRLAIEARIDLHGLTQSDAHAALVGFIRSARASGHARVLVVTGKGSPEAYAERGVLRRAVPHWLRGAELGALVLGFEEAARHHGGSGALYVRLKRR